LLGCGLLAAPWIPAFRHTPEEKWKPQSSNLGYFLLVPLVVLFVAGNLFILILCWWPADVQKTLDTKALTLPSYAGPIAGTSILAAGVAHWLWDIHILPYFGYNFWVEETKMADNVVEVTYTVSCSTFLYFEFLLFSHHTDICFLASTYGCSTLVLQHV
jgi:hypothetical protein